MKRFTVKLEQGITIVELLVVLAVSGTIMAVITNFALDYWSNLATLSNDQGTLISRMNAGDVLREGVNSASGLINQNDLPDTNTGNADPAIVSGQYWLPIHAIPGTINMGASGTISPVIYFNRPSVDTSKNVVLNGTTPYQDDVIIYMNGTKKQLLMRTIANTYATNNRAKTTCPAALATSTCPADVVISDDVSGIITRYFSRSGNTIDYTSIVDTTTGAYIGPDFPSVEVVELSLKISKKGQVHNAATTVNQTVIRIALRN